MLTQNPEYLITIVQCGNLTKAAEKLFVSQSSLSQYLKRLEANLNVQLFDRSVSPMRLTYAGELYYRYVLQWRDMDQHVQEELAEIRQELTGNLRLGIALWRGACLIPDVFPQYHKAYPGIKLEIYEGRFDQLETALMNHEIDLAIANLLSSENYERFDIEPIMQERILLAAPSANPVVQEKLQTCTYDRGLPVVSLDILNHIPVVLTKPGQNLTRIVMRSLNRHKITPDVLMETANLTTGINLCAKGICCCFVPEEGARICRHPGSVTFFSINDPDLAWTLAFVYRKGQINRGIKRNFINFTKAALQNTPKS